MRGPSKEARFSQPLVSVSLIIDELGVPIDFAVFPGNHSEFKQVAPTIERLKEQYNVHNCYFVADRGINSTSNLEEILKKSLGFIVAQKITGQSKKDTEQMLDPNGWNMTTNQISSNLNKAMVMPLCLSKEETIYINCFENADIYTPKSTRLTSQDDDVLDVKSASDNYNHQRKI